MEGLESDSKKFKELCPCCQHQMQLPETEGSAVPHHESLVALIESANSCPLCKKLLASLPLETRIGTEVTESTEPQPCVLIPELYTQRFKATWLENTQRECISIGCINDFCTVHEGTMVMLIPETGMSLIYGPDTINLLTRMCTTIRFF